ncbi:hypothetical protein EKO27_g1419 [Xylaria grammica]|uniref:Uncharacterized protein n=1 Tax=Xylaria grammica TaxID=363999 RepID=A0A439DGZ6_9PEZI|nr:hypothetical protein EKO27_g1419 [Xylaria grammica]
MAQSFVSPNFDGQIFARKFGLDTVEAHYPEIKARNEARITISATEEVSHADMFAEGDHALLKNPGFNMRDMEKLVETAQEWNKVKKFMFSTSEKLARQPPSLPVYNSWTRLQRRSGKF